MQKNAKNYPVEAAKGNHKKYKRLIMKIQTQPFTESSNASLRATEYTNDWPVVYVLENGTEAYVR